MANKKRGKVGAPIVGDRPAVFELVVNDHILYVDPKEYGIECNSIDPNDYFVTSGDAVEKAKALEKELAALEQFSAEAKAIRGLLGWGEPTPPAENNKFLPTCPLLLPKPSGCFVPVDNSSKRADSIA